LQRLDTDVEPFNIAGAFARAGSVEKHCFVWKMPLKMALMK
jgi:hypothetical protein